MRLQDVQLRNAARRGKPKASVEIARRLFSGKNGFAQNFNLGLTYSQQEIRRSNPSALLLLGDSVPLEVPMTHKCRGALAEAARFGSAMARRKLGIWLMLRTRERDEGLRWLVLSGCKLALESLVAEDLRQTARLLDALDGGSDAPAGAHSALNAGDVEDACYCLRIAAAIGPMNESLAEMVSVTVQLAAKTHSPFQLLVGLVEAGLRAQCEKGDVEGQFDLGCALTALPYGPFQPKSLVKCTNVRAASALLLRAADAGRSEAGLVLSELAPDYASACPNRARSRFLLEKAACGVALTQRRLGSALLKEATSVDKTEAGVSWFHQAASQSDSCATPEPEVTTGQDARRGAGRNFLERAAVPARLDWLVACNGGKRVSFLLYVALPIQPLQSTRPRAGGCAGKALLRRDPS